jgi:peptide/nickel transport system substrate-binding protein
MSEAVRNDFLSPEGAASRSPGRQPRENRRCRISGARRYFRPAVRPGARAPGYTMPPLRGLGTDLPDSLSVGKPRNRPAVVALATLLVVATVLAPAPGRAQSPADASAKNKELLARAPFDKITLLDDTTYEIETVAPRPLPVYDAKKAREIFKKATTTPREGNIGLPGQKSNVDPVKLKEAEEEETTLVIHTLDGDVRDYKLKREHMKSIAYYEDLLISEADRLITAGNYAKAFEYLLAAKSRQPKWPRIEETVDRLLFEEGSQALLEGSGENGLRMLGELYTRRPGYPGLGNKLATSFSSRINRAFEVGSYARGRQILEDLRKLAPDNDAVKECRVRYESRARELFARSTKATGPERLDLVLAAAAVWPSLDGLEASYREAFAAVPTLDVAVADLPTPVGPWLRSRASARTARLLYLPILGSNSEDALKGTLPEQLASGLETFDLSRGLRIKIKPGFTWNDGSRPVGAIDVARALADRTVPTLPAYSARWADLVQRIEVTEDEQVELKLSRPSLRPEHWLVAPVGPAHGGGDGWVSAVGHPRRPVGDGPYRWIPSAPGVGQYVASKTDPSTAPKVRRIREVRYDSHAAALAAFGRGEASLIEEIPPDRARELAAVEGVKVGRYATPSLHQIAIDGRTEVLRFRELRRALSLSIDRKTILEETVLRHAPDEANAVADGPFLKGSYADAPDVAPLEYNPLLALGLVAAARKEQGGGIIKLTLEYPPTPVARAVCPRLAEGWTLIGIQIVLKEVPENELEAWLRSGGRFDLAFRASRPGEPAFDAGPLICPSYDAPPSNDPLAALASPRILQLLIELDRAPEATASKDLVLQIDREARDELPILPLWQVVDHYAWRTRVKAVPAEQETLYQGVESWEVEPWFPADPR